MERKDAIRGAYRLTGGNDFYDGMITCSTLSGKAVCRLVWAMNKAENDAYLEKALSGIPAHFSGRLLEVPVGTGVLTMPVYQTMPEADITCLDYSADMMGQAQEKAERLHLKNVTFRQGDVGTLPYEDDTFDIVLSLNGFHAFPDKDAAYRETFRAIAYVLVFTYAVNGARGFLPGFWQLLLMLSVMNVMDRLLVDEFWVCHTAAWTIPGTEDLKPYITARDKLGKWCFGTLGMAAIAALLSGVMALVLS